MQNITSETCVVHQKLGFTDTDLAENFNLADNIATTDVLYLLIAETSILQTLFAQKRARNGQISVIFWCSGWLEKDG